MSVADFVAPAWLCAAGLLFCACNTTEPAAPPPKRQAPDFRNALQYKVAYSHDKSAVVVNVTVKDGFHAYTTGETTGQPMRVELSNNGAFTLSGPVEYPKGHAKSLPIGRSVIVEGRAQITAPIQRRETAKEADDVVQGSFRYQVCTDDACDRPRTETFEVKASGP